MTKAQRKQQLIEKVIQLEAAKKELERRKYLEDLFEFNRKVMQVEDGPNAVPLANFHRELCAFTIDKETNKKLILVPRGHLKSTLVTIGYTLQRIAADPTVRVLIANATYDMACSFLSQIKKHLEENDVFRDYYGDLTKNPAKWSENMIALANKRGFGRKEATVTAYGVGGNLVSQHYDVIIADDVVNRDYINTREQIEKTILFYKDALDLLEPNGTFIVIGTRWHDADLYGWIMDTTNPEQVYKNFKVFLRKAYDGNLETEEELMLLWPEKFNREILRTLKMEKGPYEFSCQYNNDPIPQDKAKFRLEWFKTVLEDELKHRELNFFTTVDPAIGQRKTSDKTAIVTIAVDQYNNWFVVNIIWDHMLPDQILNHIFDNWEQYKPIRVGIELTAYQKSLQYSLVDEMRRRNIFLPTVELKAEKSKEERIEGLIPRYANGTLYHLQQCNHRDALEDELMRFPRGKHDDIIDALAYMLQIAHQARKNRVDRSRGSKRYKYLY
jgi:predicted phage terminase large subunit-like protein